MGWSAIGAILATGFVLVARRLGVQRERRASGIGLVVAALVYVVAAAIPRNGAALLLEGVGLTVFGTLAAAGVRRWPLLLAAGWALHVLWDVVFHLIIEQPYIGTWYPSLCIGFDLVVAGYLGWRFPRVSTSSGSP